MSTKSNRKATPPPARPPERKWRPFHAAVSVCVWLNEVQTAQGTRYFRSITIGARRYLDQNDGKWKDAGSYRPSLILALDAAHTYVANTPLPGEAIDGDEVPMDIQEAVTNWAYKSSIRPVAPAACWQKWTSINR